MRFYLCGSRPFHGGTGDENRPAHGIHRRGARHRYNHHVIDLRVPATDAWGEIEPVIPLLVAYALAFINIGIFWTNHHHMLATASRVNGRALWANCS